MSLASLERTAAFFEGEGEGLVDGVLGVERGVLERGVVDGRAEERAEEMADETTELTPETGTESVGSALGSASLSVGEGCSGKVSVTLGSPLSVGRGSMAGPEVTALEGPA
jgi:hypothetical protein